MESAECIPLFHCSGCLHRFWDIRELQKCSGCRRHHYCSLICQKSHWDKHKLECVATQASIISLKEENKSRLHGWYRRWERNAIKSGLFHHTVPSDENPHVGEIFTAAPNFSRYISFCKIEFCCNLRSFHPVEIKSVLLTDENVPKHIMVSIMNDKRKLLDCPIMNYLYHWVVLFVKELKTTYYLMVVRSSERSIDMMEDTSIYSSRELLFLQRLRLRSPFPSWDCLLYKAHKSFLAFLVQEHGSSFVPFAMQALQVVGQNNFDKTKTLVLEVTPDVGGRLGAISEIDDYFVIQHGASSLVDERLPEHWWLSFKDKYNFIPLTYGIEVVDMELDEMTEDGVIKNENENRVLLNIVVGCLLAGRYTSHVLDFTRYCDTEGTATTGTGMKKNSKKNQNKNKNRTTEYYFEKLEEIDEFPLGEVVTVGSVEFGAI